MDRGGRGVRWPDGGRRPGREPRPRGAGTAPAGRNGSGGSRGAGSGPGRRTGRSSDRDRSRARGRRVVKIVMFVFNDCRTDARVLREARSLVEAGHEVRIMARPSDPQATVGDSEVVNGFTIERVPIPNAWRTWYVW